MFKIQAKLKSMFLSKQRVDDIYYENYIFIRNRVSQTRTL